MSVDSFNLDCPHPSNDTVMTNLSATWISRATTRMSFVAAVADSHIEHGCDITDRYTEESGRPYTCLIRVLGILTHVGEFGILRHHVTVFVAVELIPDEGAISIRQ